MHRPGESPLLDYVRHFDEQVQHTYTIDARHYASGSIKFGLRNSDGTGVLAGVTRIGSVQGYMMLDGEPIPMPGRLYYRGIDLREIVNAHIEEESFGFEEVMYLLLMGRLPRKTELDAFVEAVNLSGALPSGFDENVLCQAPTHNIMNMLSRAVLALYAYDEAPEDSSLEHMMCQSIEMIARLPIIMIHAYGIKRHAFNNEPLDLYRPETGLSLAENVLKMLRQDHTYSTEEARLLDLLFIIYAEHGGGTSSAFTCRMVTSAGADFYGAIAAAISVIEGPMDGGACHRVIEMFDNIHENVDDMEDENKLANYLARIIAGEANDGSGRIYGIGHAVYTQSDPRTLMLKASVAEVAKHLGYEKTFRQFETLERVAVQLLADRQAVKKPLCANVDMYTGLVFRMLHIPEDLYEPVLSVAHIASWCAHRIEERLSGNRMMRPAYRAVSPHIDYVPLAKRG